MPKLGNLANTTTTSRNNRFYEQNNSSARASRFSSTFLWRPLHDYDVKPSYATFYGGREHTTTNFLFFFLKSNWIKSLRIQLQEKSSTFDKIDATKFERMQIRLFSNVFTAVVCCAKNRRCESSRVTSSLSRCLTLLFVIILCLIWQRTLKVTVRARKTRRTKVLEERVSTGC